MVDLEKRGWFAELRAALDGPLLWLGVTVGAVSGISAITRIFHVGLRGMFYDFVQFYRALLLPIYQLINLPHWPFHVPELVVDLLAAYAVLVGMSFRGKLYETQLLSMETSTGGKMGPAKVAFDLVPLVRRPKVPWVSIVFASFLLLPIITLSPLRRDKTMESLLETLGRIRADAEYHDDLTKMRLEVRRRDALRRLAFLSLPAAIVIFFLLNAYFPKP